MRTAATRIALSIALLSIALCGCRGATKGPHPDDAPVSISNPCRAPDITWVDLAVRSADLERAPSSDLVTWTGEPEIQGSSTLGAAGSLHQGAMLFDPLDGDGPAFSVRYLGQEHSLVELIPDLPPGQCWQVPPAVTPGPPRTCTPRQQLQDRG